MINKFLPVVQNKTDDELLVIVYEFLNWDAEMLEAVEEELRKRNILPVDISERKQELIEIEEVELTQGKEASFAGQLFGWLGVLGFIGFFIGYYYTFSKVKSKYTGKEYYKYDKDSRETGRYIFYVSVSAFIISILYVLSHYNF